MCVVRTFTIPAGHPAFRGHFPGAPILPGVVLLDETLRSIAPVPASPAGAWRIGSAKFLSPVTPGETLTLEHQRLANGSIRFTIRSAGRTVATGALIPPAGATEAHHEPNAR
jgi:3-hydroxymyristoyl/3-hydroxydecanoyl-(acyl carrier protein) dehydratase